MVVVLLASMKASGSLSKLLTVAMAFGYVGTFFLGYRSYIEVFNLFYSVTKFFQNKCRIVMG